MKHLAIGPVLIRRAYIDMSDGTEYMDVSAVLVAYQKSDRIAGRVSAILPLSVIEEWRDHAERDRGWRGDELLTAYFADWLGVGVFLGSLEGKEE